MLRWSGRAIDQINDLSLLQSLSSSTQTRNLMCPGEREPQEQEESLWPCQNAFLPEHSRSYLSCEIIPIQSANISFLVNFGDCILSKTTPWRCHSPNWERVVFTHRTVSLRVFQKSLNTASWWSQTCLSLNVMAGLWNPRAYIHNLAYFCLMKCCCSLPV